MLRLLQVIFRDSFKDGFKTTKLNSTQLVNLCSWVLDHFISGKVPIKLKKEPVSYPKTDKVRKFLNYTGLA